jgi:hypothetical protein
VEKRTEVITSDTNTATFTDIPRPPQQQQPQDIKDQDRPDSRPPPAEALPHTSATFQESSPVIGPTSTADVPELPPQQLLKSQQLQKDAEEDLETIIMTTSISSYQVQPEMMEQLLDQNILHNYGLHDESRFDFNGFHTNNGFPEPPPMVAGNPLLDEKESAFITSFLDSVDQTPALDLDFQDGLANWTGQTDVGKFEEILSTRQINGFNPHYNSNTYNLQHVEPSSETELSILLSQSTTPSDPAKPAAATVSKSTLLPITHTNSGPLFNGSLPSRLDESSFSPSSSPRSLPSLPQREHPRGKSSHKHNSHSFHDSQTPPVHFPSP